MFCRCGPVGSDEIERDGRLIQEHLNSSFHRG
jgi:hypothetical protein